VVHSPARRPKSVGSPFPATSPIGQRLRLCLATTQLEARAPLSLESKPTPATQSPESPTLWPTSPLGASPRTREGRKRRARPASASPGTLRRTKEYPVPDSGLYVRALALNSPQCSPPGIENGNPGSFPARLCRKRPQRPAVRPQSSPGPSSGASTPRNSPRKVSTRGAHTSADGGRNADSDCPVSPGLVSQMSGWQIGGEPGLCGESPVVAGTPVHITVEDGRGIRNGNIVIGTSIQILRANANSEEAMAEKRDSAHPHQHYISIPTPPGVGCSQPQGQRGHSVSHSQQKDSSAVATGLLPKDKEGRTKLQGVLGISKVEITTPTSQGQRCARRPRRPHQRPTGHWTPGHRAGHKAHATYGQAPHTQKIPNSVSPPALRALCSRVAL